MVITFCGHADFQKNEEYEKKVLEILEKEVAEKSAKFYLGGYGKFDEFAYSCCKAYKKKHINVSLVFVTPYITVEYQKNKLADEIERYDEIIYPAIENKPLRFAISYRNRYMIDCSDIVVAFVEREFGGAYKAYKYAQTKSKKIYNLAQKQKDA